MAPSAVSGQMALRTPRAHPWAAAFSAWSHVHIARGALWCVLWLGFIQWALFDTGLIWRVPTGCEAWKSQGWFLHAIQANLESVHAAKQPVLVVIGSSVVGGLEEAAFRIPGWTVVVIPAADALAMDLGLLTTWCVAAGADAVVLGAMWCEFVPVEGTPWPFPPYVDTVARGPAVMVFRENIAGLISLWWRPAAQTYPRSRRAGVTGHPNHITTWPESHRWGFPRMDLGSVMNGTSAQWNWYDWWTARDWGVPIGIVQLPHNPVFDWAGVMPAGLSEATLRWLKERGNGRPVLDLAGTEPPERFIDGYHQRGLAIRSSRAIGAWAARTLVPAYVGPPIITERVRFAGLRVKDSAWTLGYQYGLRKARERIEVEDALWRSARRRARMLHRADHIRRTIQFRAADYLRAVDELLGRGSRRRRAAPKEG